MSQIAPSHCTFLALGSNLGNRLSYLLKAIDLLSREEGIELLAVSHCYQTAPWGPLASRQAPYLNMVVMMRENLEPIELFALVKAIERNMGRFDSCIHPRWSSRIIDIDIVIQRRVMCSSKLLTIPHAEMKNRLFVLRPLVDLVPDYFPPGSIDSMMTLLLNCQRRERNLTNQCQLFLMAKSILEQLAKGVLI